MLASEIMEQIKMLREQLNSNYNALYRLTDAVNDIYGNENECDTEEDRGSSVDVLCSAFKEREKTLNKMLDFYIELYNEAYQNQRETDPDLAEKRKQFLKFVMDTSIAINGAVVCEETAPTLPNFEGIWKTVYLGK